MSGRAAVISSLALAALALAPVIALAAPSPSSGFAGSGIADWTTPPAATAEPSFHPPVARSARLDNGLTVLVVENHELPIVAMTLLVPGAGSAADPGDKLGLASFTADLLDERAGGLSALAIAEAQDRLGAELEVFVDIDAAGLALRTLTKTLEPTIDLLAKILSQPSFDERDVERVRGDRLTSLAQRRDRPLEVASLMLSGALYGNRSAYGHPVAGFPEELRACSATDVRAFYSQRWNPAQMTLVVVGDVDPVKLQTKLAASLGRWTAPAATPPRAVDATPLRASRLLVADRPAAAQSDVRIGLVGPARGDPRFYAFEVLRTILGDGFTSRLTQRLREQLGITYGVRAVMDWRTQRGPFFIGTAIATAETGRGISETLKILDRLAARDVPRAELEKSKQNLIRALPAEFETNLGTSGALATLVQLGLPLDWYEHYADQIRKVTARQVRAAARSLLPSKRMVISVVGDLAQLRAQLAKLGTPVLHDAYGLPVAPR